MTNPDYTHIAVLLDRSGSMQSIKTDTEGGFATFLADQRAQPGKATLALSQFDTTYDVVHGPLDIADVPTLNLQPRGMTALLDAMGRFITETGEWLATLPEDERPGRVVFATITDGAENRSQEWTRERVFDLVTEQQKAWGWDFAFLAANQDAIAAGGSLGVAASGSAGYVASAAGVAGAYAGLSSAVSVTRSGGAFRVS